MSIVIHQNVPLVAAQGVTANVVLQPGSVVSARVVQVLGDNQALIAIGGQSINVVSQVPLQAGQTLQLAVSQTPNAIQLTVVNPQVNAASPSSAGNRRFRRFVRPGGRRGVERHGDGTAAGCFSRCYADGAAHAAAGDRGIERGAGRGDPADQSGAAVCQSRCRRGSGQPAGAGCAGGGATAGAAAEP